MTDWELMVPGMGLTILGLAGVGLSLSGLARTFVEGMHAVSALMMFIGMIILATGILKDGLPSSNTAKASIVIIIGLLVSVGAFLASLSSVSTLPIFVGILLLIVAPAGAIAYAAHKQSPHFKGIAILFTSASVVGGIAFFSFGMVAPHPVEAGEEGKVAPAGEFKGPKVEVMILAGASKEGSPAFDPAELKIEKGTMIIWTNADAVAHSVTNGLGFDDPKYSTLFDSKSLGAEKQFSLDTTKLEAGVYEYFCTFHPFMKGKFTVGGEGGIEEPEKIVGKVKENETETKGPEKEGASEIVEVPSVEEKSASSTITVDIVVGAGSSGNSEFFKPKEITVNAGTTVIWTNSDSVGHTVTSGEPGENDSGSIFDSTRDPAGFLIKPNGKFEYKFDTAGEYEYFCQVHPWMTGEVTVT